MKITLVQSDITAAVRAHILSQGISLDGKVLDVSFAMKKKGEGVVAAVSIEDAAKLPDLSDTPAKDNKPTLTVVATKVEAVEPAPAATVTNAVADNGADEPTAAPAEGQAQEATGTDDSAAAPTKTTSLFN